MTNSIFNSKEQYFAFRNAWKAAAGQKKRKSGWLQAEHHILFNILCGRSPERGFTPVTRKTKLQSGHLINHGYYHGMVTLASLCDTAKKIVSGTKVSTWNSDRLVDFLKPFNHTVTVDLLASLELPKVEPLYPNYGKTKQIATKIIEGNFKPTDFSQIYDALKEVA